MYYPRGQTSVSKRCIFLDETRYDSAVCQVGVNFYSVGHDRELCQVCPVTLPDKQSLCPFAEIYTWLRTVGGSTHIVAETVCTLEEGCTPRCASCPKQ